MRQLQSLVTADGQLQLSLVEVDRPEPRDDQVVIEVGATPINPSDLGLLLAGADLDTIETSGTDTHPVVTAQLPPGAVAALAGRIDQSMPVGNEGAGVVVAAGSSDAAQALLGKTVAAVGGAMYAEYRAVPASGAIVLPDGTDPRDGASMFVNPMTALSMPEAMRREGHTALVHTAAASNLGRMLNRICLADGIPLVNIVRKPEQVELLRDLGATHVVNSSADTFRDDLVAALIDTGATIAFDAIGGGPLGGEILGAMETAAVSSGDAAYSRYGSDTYKQLYIYGGLNRSPTSFIRNFGFSFSIGGFLLRPFLAQIGAEATARLQQRVVDEMHTTFKSEYTDEVSLAGALAPEHVRRYAQQATGEKFLITPTT